MLGNKNIIRGSGMSIINYTEAIVGIQDIQVEKVENDEENITIEFKLSRKECECPKCHIKTNKIHDYRCQRIKDTRFQGKKAVLIWHKRRYKCSCGKQFYEPNNFITRYQRMSQRKILGILEKLRTERCFTNVAREEDISTPTVIRVFDHIQYAKPKVLPEAIGIDEFKGNTGSEKFNCIITDLTTGKPIDILKTRKQDDLILYFKGFDRSNVKYIVSDMYTTYKEIATNLFRNATYVTDKYHWIRQCTWAFENTRKRVQKKYGKQYRLYFKHSRKLLIKRAKDLTSDEKTTVSILLSLEPHLSTAYYLKETLYDIVNDDSLQNKAQCLREWIEEAQDKEMAEFNSCAKTYTNWFKYIVNSFYSPYTNGPTEGCNNKIKVLKRVAYGMQNFSRFRNRILYAFS